MGILAELFSRATRPDGQTAEFKLVRALDVPCTSDVRYFTLAVEAKRLNEGEYPGTEQIDLILLGGIEGDPEKSYHTVVGQTCVQQFLQKQGIVVSPANEIDISSASSPRHRVLIAGEKRRPILLPRCHSLRTLNIVTGEIESFWDDSQETRDFKLNVRGDYSPIQEASR